MNDTLIKGKYRIVREIARSNDIVYEAQDEMFGRKIALKELNLAQGVTGQARRDRIERFHREAKAAGRLSHPHIVSIFEYGEENGRYFIAMEFLEGQTLRDKILSRGAFPIPDALEIADQILDALSYAHQRGVIHRDIKPDNIHILPGGKAKLTDFGIARLSEEPALTSNGQIFGTPSFMSPEQIAGGAIDARSDIFSLGIVLYEMLAGKRPFQGDSVVSITYAIMNAEPPSIPGIPVGLEQVLRRALAKSPLHRFGSAEEMRQAIKSADRTPPLFLNNGATGQTGMGSYPSAPMGGMNSGGYGSVPSYPSYPNAAPPPMMQGYPPPVAQGYPQPALPPTMQQPMPQQAPMPQQQNGLPWGWNGQPNNANIAPAQQYPQGYPQQQPNGQPIPQPFPQRRNEPLFVLSPGAKSFLNAILAAIVIGSAIGFGVIWFQKAYQQNQTKESNQKIVALINQGAEAYNQRDYPKAAEFFKQAWEANPQGKERTTVVANLASTYIQLAHLSETSGQWDNARTWYNRALEVDPNNKVALRGLAMILERMGQTTEAQKMRDAAEFGRDSSTPATINGRTLDSNDTPVDTGVDTYLNDQAQQAQALIQQADRALREGRPEEAEEKLREAEQKSVGIEPLHSQIVQQRRNLGSQ